MPGPDVSDRERLLRLIDGGPEVIRELQAERPVESPKATAPVPAAKQPAEPKLLAAPLPRKTFLSNLSEAQKVRLAQAALAAIVAIFAIWSVTGVIQKLPKAGASAPQQTTEGVEALRLVGVDWGDHPVALLEDKVSGKTYFVKKNDSVLGARVGEIQKDKVTVSFRGRAVELR